MNSRRHHSDESPERSSATTRTRMECLSLSHVFESARLPEFPPPRERPPYHNKGANETRRRNRMQSAKNSSLCERYCWGGCRKVPELTEEFAKQKSQKHEIRQIFNSWRRMQSRSNRSPNPQIPLTGKSIGNFADSGVRLRF
jgi:hypothetical protein